jgi:hypothetical protein
LHLPRIRLFKMAIFLLAACGAGNSHNRLRQNHMLVRDFRSAVPKPADLPAMSPGPKNLTGFNPARHRSSRNGFKFCSNGRPTRKMDQISIKSKACHVRQLYGLLVPQHSYPTIYVCDPCNITPVCHHAKSTTICLATCGPTHATNSPTMPFMECGLSSEPSPHATKSYCMHVIRCAEP